MIVSSLSAGVSLVLYVVLLYGAVFIWAVAKLYFSKSPTEDTEPDE